MYLALLIAELSRFRFFENITYTLIAPKTVAAGEVAFAGLLMSLYGALYAPSIEGYAVIVMVGKATGKELVSNTERSVAVLCSFGS